MSAPQGHNKKDSSVPGWASFMNENEYTQFLEAIDQYFVQKGKEYKHTDGIIQIKDPDFISEKMGLLNIAQKCKAEMPAPFFETVSAHFEAMIKAQNFRLELDSIVEDFDKVKQYIGVRVYPVSHIATVGFDSIISKELAEGVSAVLIFDLPDSVQTILPSQAEKWNRTLSDLFELGLANMRETYTPQIFEKDTGKFKIFGAAADHFYTPNMLFDIEDYSDLIGKYGSLIGIPHRHMVLLYPIESVEVIQAITGLIPIVIGMHSEGPGSISNNLFWYKNGKFQVLPIKIEDNKMQFTPPPEFIELLNDLAKDN